MSGPAPLRRLFRRALDEASFLFGERRCLSCAKVFVPQSHAQATKECAERLFCHSCRLAIARREKGLCPHCGEPAAWPELPVAPCGRCLQQRPPWRTFACHALHEGLLRGLLIRLKFKEDIALAHGLGQLLASHPALESVSLDAIVPVPLHRERLAERGFNQALELARPLAKRLRLPLAPELLHRSRATKPQTGASRATRMQSMKNAFSGSPAACGKRLLLVDDTVTTGATLDASARALLESGAAAVDVAVVSRTPRYYASRK